jgi:RimJ/RimL family protein N-acetyltransferase/pimeloyl-ACP methyl ester carboxylesterase
VTRVVFVHGSVGAADATWSAQRPLGERFELLLVTRGGYPPGPPLERIDFEEQAQELAALLRPGDHLVGHSYGGVISLLAAARSPVLDSLTVNEPPAFDVARGDPAVEAFLGAFEGRTFAGPEEYLQFFLPLVGSVLPSAPLSAALEQGTRAAMAERSPHEAVVPLETLAAEPFAKLVVSGAHNAALDAVCDVLEAALGAERAVLPGAGHSLPRAPGYNDVLVSFVERAATLGTERLVLRPPTRAERDELRAQWLDEANERVPPGTPLAQVQAWIDGVPLVVRERESGELVGDAGLFFAEEHAAWELAYGFRRDVWGRGYATEAAHALVARGFERWRLPRIVADVDPANAASVRVLEKCGFVRAGGEPPKLVYALDASAWRLRSQSSA